MQDGGSRAPMQQLSSPMQRAETLLESRRLRGEYSKLLAEELVGGEPKAAIPDATGASFFVNLGNALKSSGHHVEAAQRFLEAQERCRVGSQDWAAATARAFSQLQLPECAGVAKPAWWNDEDLKRLSKRVVRAAPTDTVAHFMRVDVLCGDESEAWVAGPRSAADFKEAAMHYERCCALEPAEVTQAVYLRSAAACRSTAEAMEAWPATGAAAWEAAWLSHMGCLARSLCAR